jgi:hypothetical protein
MAWIIVRQPNGLLARFSGNVDNFTNLNMTEAEALECCLEYCGTRDARRKVSAGVMDRGLDRWSDCIDTIKTTHGKKAAARVLALDATPRGACEN